MIVQKEAKKENNAGKILLNKRHCALECLVERVMLPVFIFL